MANCRCYFAGVKPDVIVLDIGMPKLNGLRSPNHLTLRQREVLQLLAEGRSMKEAGYILNLTPRTVAFHKYKMMELLHLRSNTDLLRFALTRSLVAVT
jgi:DNA-binding NarL/FixJ family response regulator